MKKKQLKTIAEYAAEQGVSHTTVHNWIKKGKVKAKQIGKIKLIEI